MRSITSDGRARDARRRPTASALAIGIAAFGQAAPAAAQEAAEKPNILFIMGDDIGWMQPSIYHRGLMVGETPNIDRIGQEGAMFTDYYAEQSCTAGRNAFFTGMHPLRVRHDPCRSFPAARPTCGPARRRSPSSCAISATTPASSARTTSATTPTSLPTAHGFQEFWGYLYHLDAMQGVSFPDINKSPTEQTVAPPCQNTPIPGLAEVPGGGRSADHALPDAAAAGAPLHVLRRHRRRTRPAPTRGR